MEDEQHLNTVPNASDAEMPAAEAVEAPVEEIGVPPEGTGEAPVETAPETGNGAGPVVDWDKNGEPASPEMVPAE